MIILISLVSFAAWIYLIGFRGRFWRSSPTLDRGFPSGQAKVAVVVPARDEAQSIRQSVESLLAQNYPGELSIILVDDNSSDGTGAIAASLSDGERLTIINGKPLPAGWSGKLWAVHQGLAYAKAERAEYVLLTDADIVHAPGHLSALVAKAEKDRMDLVSEMVHLNCITRAERATIPAFVFFFQMLYPFASVADPAKRVAGAAGGTMLVLRAALDRIEGVTHFRDQLIDDCALAREIKSSGGRIWLGYAEDTFSMRVYSCWRDVWDMIARTAYEQLRHSPLLLLGCVVAMSLVYCAPPLLALLAHGPARILGLAAWLLMAVTFQPTLLRYRRSPLWGLALPGIGTFYLCATIASAIRHHAGRGGGWKNRVYPEGPVA
jgi:hopene-associated glycosyltransferase HpnB